MARRNARAAAAVLTLWAAAAALQAGGAWPRGEREPVQLPERLRDTGLYTPGGLEVNGANRAFSPQYPLWTDGAEKRRWVYLPPGAVIDGADESAWVLPVGTKFWKEFRFSGRPVETRMSWRVSATRWVFASYQWNDAGTDATLVPDDGAFGVAEVAPGKRHNIPARSDCLACHGSASERPLGFNALQLSQDRDPNAIHGEPLTPDMVTLDVLVREGRLRAARADIVSRPPRITSADPDTRAMLGYLFGNCASCHNGQGEIAALGPVMRLADLLTDGDAVARGLVGQRTSWTVPGVPRGHSVVLDPADPEQSAMLVRMRSRRPSSQMPPLGTVVRDDDAVAAIEAWVRRQR